VVTVEKYGWDAVAEATKDAKAIAWDGCHKIYLCMDDEQVAQQQQYGYGEGGSYLIRWQNPDEMLATLREWYEESCGLKFICAVTTNEADPNEGFVNLIPQCWNEDDED
jgi:hypothetical protein